MEKCTLLENIVDLVDNTQSFDKIVITKENISQIVSDFSIPHETRLEAIEKYYQYYGDEIIEILRRLVGIFNISSNITIETYISRICIETSIPFEFRLESAKDLSLCKDTDECFKPLDILCSRLRVLDIPTPKKVDAICVLMRRERFKHHALDYFLEIIHNTSLDCEYRYKIINSLKYLFDFRKTFKTEEEIKKIDEDLMFYEKESMYEFINNTENTPEMRILAGQLLLSKYKHEKIEPMLIDISTNIINKYNTRADAVDVVLRYGNETYKNTCRDILKELGGTDTKNIYQNAQNAHTQKIEQSAIDSIEKLFKNQSLKNQSEKISFEDVMNDLISQGFSKISLNRILLDNALYSQMCVSLKTALVLVYIYVKESPYQEILFDRLKEELYESEGICSTGILERIVNTLSGFDDELGLRISFEDQIMGILSAKLNAEIRRISIECIHSKMCDCIDYRCEAIKKGFKCNSCIVCIQRICTHVCSETDNCGEELSSKILNEMTIPTKFYNKRKNFLRFFRLYISKIMEEIRDEFKDDIDIASFDLFFKRALINYEGET